MSFLLDDRISAENLHGRLTAAESSLLHFVIGERQARAGNTLEAAAEFETAVREAKDRNAWYVQSASGQLNELRGPSTGPAAGASSRPEEGSGAP